MDIAKYHIWFIIKIIHIKFSQMLINKWLRNIEVNRSCFGVRLYFSTFRTWNNRNVQKYRCELDNSLSKFMQMINNRFTWFFITESAYIVRHGWTISKMNLHVKINTYRIDLNLIIPKSNQHDISLTFWKVVVDLAYLRIMHNNENK